MQTQDFQLVVSGINRGDNCGLHVIYSGTVGAAREAACKASAGGRTRAGAACALPELSSLDTPATAMQAC